MWSDPPSWVSWKSSENFLPAEFFDVKSVVSLPAFLKWTTTNLLTTEDHYLASYKQVKHVALGFGLVLCTLWIAQFLDSCDKVPAYIFESPYPFMQYEQLCYKIEDCITRYEDMYVSTFFAHGQYIIKSLDSLILTQIDLLLSRNLLHPHKGNPPAFLPIHLRVQWILPDWRWIQPIPYWHLPNLRPLLFNPNQYIFFIFVIYFYPTCITASMGSLVSPTHFNISERRSDWLDLHGIH